MIRGLGFLSILFTRNLLLLLLLGYFSYGVYAVDDATPTVSPRLPRSTDLTWNVLPAELTRAATPFDEYNLKVGTLSNGQEYLTITARKKGGVSFGIRPQEYSGAPYVASAQRASYWPDQHLLRFDKDVIVSASTCRMEGKTLDIHLIHDTVRLVEPQAITLPNGLVSILGPSVRISGLGHPSKLRFVWDEKQPELPAPKPAPTIVKSSSDFTLIHLGTKGEIRWGDAKLDPEKFRQRVRELAQKAPDTRFKIEQEPGTNVSLVKTVHDVLSESGFDRIETVTVREPLRKQALKPETEVSSPREIPDAPPATNKGARLLWIQSAGNYLLNGKLYDEPGLRQTLRGLARVSPDVPLILATPRGFRTESLHELIKDLRAYGFKEILVAVDPEKLR